MEIKFKEKKSLSFPFNKMLAKHWTQIRPNTIIYMIEQ